MRDEQPEEECIVVFILSEYPIDIDAITLSSSENRCSDWVSLMLKG